MLPELSTVVSVNSLSKIHYPAQINIESCLSVASIPDASTRWLSSKQLVPPLLVKLRPSKLNTLFGTERQVRNNVSSTYSINTSTSIALGNSPPLLLAWGGMSNSDPSQWTAGSQEVISQLIFLSRTAPLGDIVRRAEECFCQLDHSKESQTILHRVHHAISSFTEEYHSELKEDFLSYCCCKGTLPHDLIRRRRLISLLITQCIPPSNLIPASVTATISTSNIVVYPIEFICNIVRISVDLSQLS